MQHKYRLQTRYNENVMPMSEETIITLLSHGEVEYVRTHHMGRDVTLTHVFKFVEMS